ncbi:uncharacterized protein [Henckelia pumila]|uniref:uncharacterized protein n=1 Tax=Henckelia pumila TaxID=405737 RepID=UPI003C6DEB7C
MDLGEYKVEPVVTSLFGFTGHAIRPTGLINLPLTLGKDRTSKTRIVSFIIVDAPSAYNVILRRPVMTTFMAVASALYQKIKFPVGNEVGEVQGDQKISRKCYVEEVRIEQKAVKIKHDDRPGPRDREQVNLLEENAPVMAEEECEEIIICPPTGSVKVARTLEPILKKQLIQCLMENKDAFAWSVSDLLGVRREVMEHKLNVIRDYRPIIQKKRNFGPEKDAVIQGQVEELLKAGHIQEVYFPTWLSNVVLVPKSSGKWRMCVYFRDLNKACPKDCYPLPRIDQLVDSTSGHELLCFLDAYQGYHQIPMAKQDQDKTWKFLGYMVTRRGIEANLEKFQAIISMESPKNIQEVQRLSERIAALARFISRSADKSFLFFKALRKTKNFEWDEQSEKSFQELKKYLKEFAFCVL